MTSPTEPGVDRRAVLARLAAAAAASVGLPAPSRAADAIVVGATVPITGTFAASGVQYHNALKLAEADINAAGGIGGRSLHIAFEDTAASNSTAVNAFVKLVKQQKPPFVFVSSLSTQALAMEPEVARAKVAAVYGGGAIAIGARHNPWMFRIRPADQLQAGAIAYGLTTVLKKTRPGIVYAQDDYGLGLAHALEAVLAKSGVTVVAKEAFNPRDNDFSAQLLALKGKGVDAIVSINYNRDGALILKQRKSLGLDMPLVAGTGMSAPATLDLVDAADLVDVYSTTDAVLGAAIGPASASFVARYLAAYQFRPDSFGAAYYDSAMILADGLRQVGPDAEKLRSYFAALRSYKGVARTYSTDPATNDMAHSVALVKFKPGSKEFVAVASYPAS